MLLSQQPFSVLSSKLKDLDSSMKKIEDDIERTHIYLTSLKDDANNDYDYMTSTFIQLKKYEAILRKINVQSLTLTFNENFKKCYQLLNECGDLTSYLPIDVALLNEKVKEISLCFEEIKSNISSIEENVKNAEDSVVRANAYRQNFDDVKTTLLRAEKSFFEGDFIRTFDETSALIKKIKPDTGK